MRGSNLLSILTLESTQRCSRREWLSRSLILAFPLLAILLSSCATTTSSNVPTDWRNKEYIIVSGGPSLIEWEKYKRVPHDRWWGNFIRTARVRMQQLRKELGYEARITWLVYRPGYARRGQRQDNRDLLALIRSVEEKYKVNLVWFDDGQEVIDYLNHGMPRSVWKIANFEYYGHSNRACFMFDYSNEIDSGSKSWLHEDELTRIHRGIFARGAHVKSWGCHTGESMSQKWRKATGVKMYGAVGKTDYSNGEVPFLSSRGGRWSF